MNLLTRILALLQQIEWAGDSTYFACPACRRHREHGHDEGCMLAAILFILEKRP